MQDGEQTAELEESVEEVVVVFVTDQQTFERLQPADGAFDFVVVPEKSPFAVLISETIMTDVAGVANRRLAVAHTARTRACCRLV